MGWVFHLTQLDEHSKYWSRAKHFFPSSRNTRIFMHRSSAFGISIIRCRIISITIYESLVGSNSRHNLNHAFQWRFICAKCNRAEEMMITSMDVYVHVCSLLIVFYDNRKTYSINIKKYLSHTTWISFLANSNSNIYSIIIISFRRRSQPANTAILSHGSVDLLSCLPSATCSISNHSFHWTEF